MGSRHFSEGGYDRIAIKLFQKLNVAYLTLLPPTLEVSHSLLLGHITSSMIRRELEASSPCSTCLRIRTLSSASLPPSSQSLRTSSRWRSGYSLQLMLLQRVLDRRESRRCKEWVLAHNVDLLVTRKETCWVGRIWRINSLWWERSPMMSGRVSHRWPSDGDFISNKYSKVGWDWIL